MEKYIQMIRNASNDIWKVFKQHCDVRDKPDYFFQELIDQYNEIEEKYEGTAAENYVKNYILNVMIPEIDILHQKYLGIRD